MDKYEYNLKMEQIKKLIGRRDYTTAAQICDSIEWKRVKNNNTLTMVADVYEAVKQYEKAKDILLIAYERSPLGRQLAYRLTLLSVREKDFLEADEFYQDFVEVAPQDVGQYILKYEIAKAKGEDIDVLIQILRSYAEVDIDEKWQYELAYLYHKAGYIEECIDQCNELYLWFNDGKYVEMALKLKQKYAPLTKSQQETLRQMEHGLPSAQEAAAKEEMPEAEDGKTKEIVVEARKDTEAKTEEPEKKKRTVLEKEMPETEDEIVIEEKNIPKEVPEVKVGVYDTTNLQETIANSMAQLLKEMENNRQKVTKEKERETEEDEPESIETEETEEKLAEDEAVERESIEEDSVEEKPIEEEAMKDRESESEETALPEEKISKEKEEPDEEEADFKERESKEAATQEEPEETQEMETGMEAVAAEGEPERPEEDETTIETDVEEEANEVKPEEHLAPDEREEAKEEDKIQETEEMEAETEAVAAEGEPEKFEENETMAETDVMEKAEPKSIAIEEDLEETEPEHTAIEEDLEETEPEHTAIEEDLEETEPERIVTPKEPEEDWRKDLAELGEEPDDLMKALEAIEREITASERTLEKSRRGKEQAKKEELMKEEPEEEKPKKPEVKVPKEPEKEIPQEKKKYFTQFLEMRGLESQIAETLENLKDKYSADGTSAKNNVCIMGESKTGRSTLALSIMKVANRDRQRRGRKVAKVKGVTLNKRSMRNSMGKLLGADLLIEQAGSLTPNMVQEIEEVMQGYTGGMLVILEDDQAALERLFDIHPEFAKMFSNHIEIKEYDINEWVRIAQNYANDQGYGIDEMGTLALYAKVSEIVGVNQEITKEDIANIIDSAIEKSERKNLGKLFDIVFSRKYKDSDLAMLRESDFQ